MQSHPLAVAVKEGAAAASLQGTSLTLPLPAGAQGLAMPALREALKPHLGSKAAKRLHFHAPKAAWGGFGDPKLEKEFGEVGLSMNAWPCWH